MGWVCLSHRMAGFRILGFWGFHILRQATENITEALHGWLLGFCGFKGLQTKITYNITGVLHGWFYGFWGFEGFTDFIKSQRAPLQHSMAGFRVFRVSQTSSSHREHYYSTVWLGFQFLGFESFTNYIKSQTILLEHHKAGFWVFGVLRVLQSSSSHKQYY